MRRTFARAADIQDAQLAPLCKILCLEGVVGGQAQRLFGRHRGANHRAIQIDIGQVDLSRLK